jgi:glucose uptake protein GlcU
MAQWSTKTKIKRLCLLICFEECFLFFVRDKKVKLILGILYFELFVDVFVLKKKKNKRENKKMHDSMNKPMRILYISNANIHMYKPIKILSSLYTNPG